MLVPAGADKHGFAAQLVAFQILSADGSTPGAVHSDHDAVQIGQSLEGKLRQVRAMGVAMKRRVEIGAGISHHFDLADLEFRPVGVQGSRLLSAEKVANERRRQPPISDHAIFDRVAQVNQHHIFSVMRNGPKNPILGAPRKSPKTSQVHPDLTFFELYSIFCLRRYSLCIY